MKNAMPAQRLVIKVGSSLVTRGGQGVDQQALNHWADQVAALRARAAAAPHADAPGRHARDEEAAERLAVRLVLPLGACHLPAFVILGIAPVVASVGMSMLSG